MDAVTGLSASGSGVHLHHHRVPGRGRRQGRVAAGPGDRAGGPDGARCGDDGGRDRRAPGAPQGRGDDPRGVHHGRHPRAGGRGPAGDADQGGSSRPPNAPASCWTPDERRPPGLHRPASCVRAWTVPGAARERSRLDRCGTAGVRGGDPLERVAVGRCTVLQPYDLVVERLVVAFQGPGLLGDQEGVDAPSGCRARRCRPNRRRRSRRGPLRSVRGSAGSSRA